MTAAAAHRRVGPPSQVVSIHPHPESRSVAECDGITAQSKPTANNPYTTLAAIAAERWIDDALCAQTDPDSFFPEKGGSVREARRICLRCPVRAECLDYALAHDERFGVWGGYSERERRALKRERWRHREDREIAEHIRDI